MSVAITVKVRKSVAKLADRMVKLGLARSRSHAINVMIERSIERVEDEVSFWERVEERVSQLLKDDRKVSHSGLSKLLEEGRSER
ncbi:MAG: hypothetical protein QXG57_04540 [Thermofilaceae archaeon]